MRTRLFAASLSLSLAMAARAGAVESGDATLEEIDRIVTRDFYDPAVLRERDWPGLVAQARARLRDAATDDDRARVFERLLAGLRTSHTGYVARNDPRYADLAAIFDRVLRGSDEHCADHSRLPPSPLRVDEIGVWWRRERDRWFVGGLLAQGAAQEAGLLAGDEIVAADGAPFSPVASFAGKAGRAVRLEYRRARDGATAFVDATPRSSEPMAMYAAATKASKRLIERGRARIGYVRLWSGVGASTEEARAAIRDLDGDGITALILDLRDGWGGVPPEFISIFDRRVPVLVSRSRDGRTYRFDGQVRVPTIVLVNDGVHSGKEVLALSIQRHRLAELLGKPTPGALLPGSAYCLADGGLLYLAVGVSIIDGEVREGKGVAPDVAVPFDLPYAAGRDPQFDAAVARLARARNGKSDRAAE